MTTSEAIEILKALPERDKVSCFHFTLGVLSHKALVGARPLESKIAAEALTCTAEFAETLTGMRKEREAA